MERVPVESSTLMSVGYAPDSTMLEVEFRGGIYLYFGVSADIHEGLMSAGSKGSYFNQFIRNEYPCSKVS